MTQTVSKKIDVAKIKEGMRATSPKSIIHVIPQKGRWVVKQSGASRANGTFDLKDEAISRARSLAQKGHAKDILVHREDATVEKWEKSS